MVKRFLKKNSNYIVFAGLILGLLSIFNAIPMDLLGDYTQYVAAAVIVVSGYCFYEYYFNKTVSTPSYDTRYPSRDLNNPKYREELERQMRR